jgi:SOS-response transcriptional repressor LexA
MSESRLVDPANVGKRIKHIRGKRTLHQFANLVGVSHTSVKRHEDGTLPDINILLKIAKIGEVDLGWLLLGKPLPSDVREYRPLQFKVDAPQSVTGARLNEADYISVPLTEGKIAAGNPRIAEEDVIDYFLFHMRALKKAGVSRDLIACRLEGESMAPHLNSGDVVVIDRGIDKERIEEKKIYAIYMDGGITAKTIQKEGYHLYLIPSNISEKIQHIDLREDESPIVGLVIGAWKNLEQGIL